MNNARYQLILYTIVAVIIATIGIQVYWNYKNYQTNKQQLINDVQVSLDKAVDDYYTNLAKQTTIGVFMDDVEDKGNIFGNEGKFERFLKKNIDSVTKTFKNLDSLDINNIAGVTVLKGFDVDSIETILNEERSPLSITNFKNSKDTLKFKTSGIDFKDIESLTSRVIISINNDSLDVKEIDSLLKLEFKRKQISVDYTLDFKAPEAHSELSFLAIKSDTIPKNATSKILSTVSKSTYLPHGSTLKVNFTNETQQVLKRSLGGILISTLLILAVISCLFYLLKIIKHQKQLAEVKNDLISNITHEFKTPIATIGVALESISNFNALEDKTKTKNYINMSTEQLSKLNVMVEKLLETATLDSENLELNKEKTDIVDLISVLYNRYKIQFPEKTFDIQFKPETLWATVDVFHFENAINNIIDNAVKYGGDTIKILIAENNNDLEILISDNGNTLTKNSKERIFEKFYRVPKGNTHNVKGFGIGLYYTKTIIEKHNGTVSLDLSNQLTTFKITLPNG